MEFHMAGVWTRKMKSRYGFKYTDIYWGNLWELI
jgi:hypothetical protein